MLKEVTTGSTQQQVWQRLLRNEPLFILDVRTATCSNAGG